MISNYQEFLLEKEFSDLLQSLLFLTESEGRQTSPNTIEWDLTRPVKDAPPVTMEWDLTETEEEGFIEKAIRKIESFLQKIPKEKIKYYFDKFIETIASLPDEIRRKMLMAAAVTFLGTSALQSLEAPDTPQMQSQTISKDPKKSTRFERVKEEFKRIARKSTFNIAQELVSFAEALYSDDTKDTGNWVKDKRGRKVFVGTKYGISAPVLQDYLNRVPTASDMKNLKYSTALEIFKRDYWDAQNLHLIADQNVANILYDACVNQGVEGTEEIAQKYGLKD